MPGVERLGIDILVQEAEAAMSLGIESIAVFPATPPERKTPGAEEALNPDNLVNQAVRALKEVLPKLEVVCDVALDPYSSHGHDGLVVDGYVANDATVEVLCEQAVLQARSGCDVIAPSDMMDGRVGAIRHALDRAGFDGVHIMSYAAKYASGFYGPFRDAVGSAANLGGAGKKTYQMDPGNTDEALLECALDLAEEADSLMVKPGMPYLDIVYRVSRDEETPVYVYQVSGEYAAIHAASGADEALRQRLMLESLQAFLRAGASGVLTYFAVDAARALG